MKTTKLMRLDDYYRLLVSLVISLLFFALALTAVTALAQDLGTPCNGDYTYEIVNYNPDAAAVQFQAVNDDPRFKHKWFLNGILLPDTVPDPLYVFRPTPFPAYRITYCNECDNAGGGCDIDCASCHSEMLVITEPVVTSSGYHTQAVGNLAPGTPVLIGDLAGRGIRYDYTPVKLKPGELVYMVFRR